MRKTWDREEKWLFLSYTGGWRQTYSSPHGPKHPSGEHTRVAAVAEVPSPRVGQVRLWLSVTLMARLRLATTVFHPLRAGSPPFLGTPHSHPSALANRASVMIDRERLEWPSPLFQRGLRVQCPRTDRKGYGARISGVKWKSTRTIRKHLLSFPIPSPVKGILKAGM